MMQIADNRQDDMWVSGWMLGKYDQLQALPQSEPEAKEWWEGFTLGNVEANLYEKTRDRLEILLADYPKECRLVKMVISQRH